MRVLAVNQHSTVEEGGALKSPASVTLEVSQKDAQKLRLGEKSGTLSLSLRSLKEVADAKVVRPVGAGDLSRTTPPSSFPVLYGFNDDDVVPEAQEGAEGLKAVYEGSVSVVRGVTAQNVEINRP